MKSDKVELSGSINPQLENRLDFTPSPAGEGWGEENKISFFISPHPSLLPQGRRGRNLCRNLCFRRGLFLLGFNPLRISKPKLS
jgi:hypothetical protein